MEQLDRRIRALLWPGEPPASPLAAGALRVGRYAYGLIRDFLEGELSLRAMSLVYTTILSIVPLLAFSFAVLKGLGFHRDAEPLLMRLLAPVGAERAAEIADAVVGFVDNVDGSVLASLSIVVFLFTALSMAQKVESSFNFVWRIDRPRSLARRLSEYVSVMVLGPLVMTLAMGLIATVSSTTLMARVRRVDPLGTWIAWAGDLAPYVLLIGAFTFLYVFIPNVRVRLKPALIGGVCAGVTWAVCGQAFAALVSGATRTEAVYSGFAIVVVVMIWMYLSWLILLLGAQLTFYLQHPDYLRLGQRAQVAANGVRERLALSTMLLVAKDFDQHAHGWRGESLAARLRVPRYHIERVINTLSEAGLLTETTEQRLIPARDPHRIRIADVLGAVRHPTDGAFPETHDWNVTVASLADRIERAIEAALEERTLADLVDEDRAATEQPS